MPYAQNDHQSGSVIVHISNPLKVMGITPPTRKKKLISKKTVVWRGTLKSPLMARSKDLKRSSAPPSVRALIMSEYCSTADRRNYSNTVHYG